MTPKILLATTCRWVFAARLAMAFKKNGAEVAIVCPDGHPVARTGACGIVYTFHAMAPLASFRSAIHAAQPDVVIPCDDLARSHLNRLYRQALARGSAARPLLERLQRSMGDPSGYPVTGARTSLIGIAREEGIAAPVTSIIPSIHELHAWIARHGMPAVLKTDGTSGGVGVRIVEDTQEAEHAFHLLQSPPLIARALKRTLIDRDSTLLVPSVMRRRPTVNIQQFIAGREACSAIVCWQGNVLAAIHYEILRTWKERGPASVIRVVSNPAMQQAAEKIAKRLGLSGFCGLDFVFDDATGAPHLIEMNPRATQACHFPLGTGRNLPAALTAVLAGKPIPETASVTQKDTLALFPLEWQNDAASSFLNTAYHDVPWEEPGLVRFCVDGWMRSQSTTLSAKLTRLYLERIGHQR